MCKDHPLHSAVLRSAREEREEYGTLLPTRLRPVSLGSLLCHSATLAGHLHFSSAEESPHPNDHVSHVSN